MTEHYLRCALHHDQPFLVWHPVNGGHELILGLEGNGIDSLQMLPLGVDGDAELHCRRYQGTLGRIPGELPKFLFAKHFGIVAECGIEAQVADWLGNLRYQPSMLLELSRWLIPNTGHFIVAAFRPKRVGRHLVSGQGTRFIRADGGGASKCLHGGQLADNGPARGHALYPNRERDRYNRWEAFGNCSDGEGNRKDKCILEGSGEGHAVRHHSRNADDDHDQGNDQYGNRDHLADDFERLREWRLEINHLPQ